MNKSVTPPKRGNPIHRTPPSNQKSNSAKSPVRREAYLEVGVEERLRRNREKLVHTLDTYTMLIRSNSQIRCLEHNSVVSIFCETENRLLCTNCVFGKNQHKFHKIYPIDRSYEKIQQSVQKMKPVVKKQITVLDNIKQIILNSLDQEIVDFEKGLNTLALKYEEAHRLIDQNFIRAKANLLNLSQQIKLKHETVALELNFLSDVYDADAPLASLDFSRLDRNQILVYQYSLLYTLSNQKKFEGNVWNVPRNQMRKACGQQQKIIGKICDDLLAHVKIR